MHRGCKFLPKFWPLVRVSFYQNLSAPVDNTGPSVPVVAPSQGRESTGEWLLVTDEGRIETFFFGIEPTLHCRNPLLDQYLIHALVTLGDPPVYQPKWNININDQVVVPRQLWKCWRGCNFAEMGSSLLGTNSGTWNEYLLALSCMYVPSEP